MNKLVCLALIVASAAVASSSLAATKNKSANLAKGAQWADMPNGKAHKLRKVDIHDAQAKDWDTHAIVTLDTKNASDPSCNWTGTNPPPTPNLDGAKLLVQNDSGGPMLYLMFPGSKTYVARSFTLETAGGNSRWLSSESDTDWNYYVFFEKGTPTTPGRMVKRYRVEAFPPRQYASATCNAERPPDSVNLVLTGDGEGEAGSRSCQAGSGSGNEPHH